MYKLLFEIRMCFCFVFFRWLSHFKACVRFIRRHEELLDTFDSLIEASRDQEVQGIRCSATRRDIVAMMLVLADVLKPVNFLSLYLQQDCGTFTDLPARVNKCTDDLHDIVHHYQNMELTGHEFRYYLLKLQAQPFLQTFQIIIYTQLTR